MKEIDRLRIEHRARGDVIDGQEQAILEIVAEVDRLRAAMREAHAELVRFRGGAVARAREALRSALGLPSEAVGMPCP